MHTLASCHRLLDVLECVEPDPRTQTVFTVAPDVFNASVDRHLRNLGAVVVPWRQAVRERFDLAVAAACGGVHRLHAPIMLMAHGAGRGKRVRPVTDGGTSPVDLAVYGLDTGRLTKDGRVVPAAILLSHERERDILCRQCPAALPVAVMAGDPCLDRLVISQSARPRYRRAYGLNEDQTLVLVSSTWGRDGLFGTSPELLTRLMDELPAARFRIGALLHPAIWAAHGARQIRAWLGDCLARGLILPDPANDWRTLLIAADRVIGDHGSVTAYAAGIGRPVLRTAGQPPPDVVPGSAQEVTLDRATRLDLSRPLADQVARAPAADPAPVTALLTSRPGEADLVIRRTMYQLLNLAEPMPGRRPPALAASAVHGGQIVEPTPQILRAG